jgi:glucose-specific phosphotransferase system IIA component
MGLFDKLKKKLMDNESIHVPVNGKVISLKDIADGVFSEGILGKGVGIIPKEEIIYAPFDGQVTVIADTKHAIGLKSKNGVELLIHVGIETVEMKGEGFEQQVQVGDSIKIGQQIMTFSLKEIQKAGYPSTIAVIVTNSDDYSEVKVLGEGDMEKQEELIQVL